MGTEYRGQYEQANNVVLVPGDYFRMYDTNEVERFRISTLMDKEPETVFWIRSFTKDCIFFDVGACIGIYSLFCQSIHPESIIRVFEPQRTNLDRLLENASLNRFTRWEPKAPVAIGSKDNEWLWFTPGTDIPGAADGVLSPDRPTDPRAYQVPEYTLDTMASIYGTPTYIKIDVDGNEYDVVQGMARILPDPKLKSMLIEVSTADRGIYDTIVNLMIYHGFSTDNDFNLMTPHSRERREAEGIEVENIVFTRG